jgi:NAD+ synthase (glutamine-hydrolysing)
MWTEMSTAPHGFVRVAAASPPVRVGDPDANVDATLGIVARAGDEGAQVLVLPELGLTGYTCGDLFFGLSTLVAGAERALVRLLRETSRSPMILVVGLPVERRGRLFDAAAVLQSGRLLGVVPKTYLPGYQEYYEERWFSSARDACGSEVVLGGATVPFGTDLLFQVPEEPGLCLAAEICEDLWAPVPPSSRHAVAGATVILNPSASNDIVAKAEYRRELVRQQSGRTLAAYVYAGAGVHESTTDLVFGGHLMIAENGVLLGEGERFARNGALLVTDVDTEKLRVERARQTSFAEAGHESGGTYRVVPLSAVPAPRPHRLLRRIDPHPFVPADAATLDERCREIFSIQTAALARRLEHVGVRRVVLGLSGGLDSTLALVVAARTFDLLELDRGGILAVTMPGFGTSTRTREVAHRLGKALGVELREVDIRAACEQHIRDIALSPDDRESVTYQNLQARERTQVLMDLANMEGGLVVGTGDLSEIALGFATFAGDHISMYNVNAGVPKTLVRRLVRWVADHRASASESAVLVDVLETPVSPELVPPGADGAISQRSEDIVGPYELADFYLFGMLRLGAGPAKLLFLARHAFGDRYDPAELRRWLRVFLERFFASQFKRSVMPDGPKVGSVSLSPRGDWRMPSDASADAWLRALDEAEDP